MMGNTGTRAYFGIRLHLRRCPHSFQRCPHFPQRSPRRVEDITVSLAWLAERLHVGSLGYVSLLTCRKIENKVEIH